MKSLILVFITMLLIFVQSIDQGDWVDPYNLPISYITHPFFAGYLNISSTHQYYYNYFPSEANPNKDPLMVRISGGPACSALYSTYYSKGPFIFVRNSKSFRVNPFNWNKEANVLFIQGPAGVGFSKGQVKQYNDQNVAESFYYALLKFYEKFPELKDQDAYLSGENYAGILIPRIALMITQQNRDPDTPAWSKVRLAGLLLNNPCTQGDQCDSHQSFTSYTIKYLKAHYFISEEEFGQYRDQCTLPTQECQKIKSSIESHFYDTGADLGNIYGECLLQQGAERRCMDEVGIKSFFRDGDVIKTMHADPSITWSQCNNEIAKNWVRDPMGSIQIYQKLLRQQHVLRIWIVSGVLSSLVPITGTKKWFEQVKMNAGLATTRMWQPWYYNHTVNAGDIEQTRGMSLITVRSGGYHLWNQQPQLTYHILDSFLKGIPL